MADRRNSASFRCLPQQQSTTCSPSDVGVNFGYKSKCASRNKRMLIKNQYSFHCDFVGDLFLLLQTDPKSVETTAKQTKQESELPDFSRVRCPLCKWQPNPSHRWFCAQCESPEFFADGCGTCWNTFNTRGRCPGCGHQWRWTACLNCEGWSLHSDWYENESMKRQ